MDKNTSAGQAQSALGLGDMGAFDLLDAVKQEYTTQREQADDAIAQSRPTLAQRHWLAAACLADLLSRAYQARGDCVEAETWSTRAIRFYRRSKGFNAVARGIGAEMP